MGNSYLDKDTIRSCFSVKDRLKSKLKRMFGFRKTSDFLGELGQENAKKESLALKCLEIDILETSQLELD